MNAKKFVGFLLMRPAFTQRNMTSIILVACFFGVYVMMGGKITTKLPTPQEAGAFGEIDGAGQAAEELTSDPQAAEAAASQNARKKKSPMQLLGLKPSKKRVARERAILGRKLFDDEEREELEGEPLDKEGLVQGVVDKNKHLERRLDRLEQRRDSDSLSAIEERLSIRRK